MLFSLQPFSVNEVDFGLQYPHSRDIPNLDEIKTKKMITFDWFFFNSAIEWRTFNAIKVNSENLNIAIAALHSGTSYCRVELKKYHHQQTYLYQIFSVEFRNTIASSNDASDCYRLSIQI